MTKTIFSIVAVALDGGIFFFYTKPAYDSTQAIQAQIASYNGALDKAAELQALKQQLLSRYNAFSPESIDRLQKLLPDHVDNVALILDLDNLAARFGLPLENVDVATPASTASSQGAIGTLGSGSGKQDSIAIRFSTAGTYNDFLQFMLELERSLRIVDLVSLSLSPQGVSSPTTGLPLYRYDITLRTYWLR